MRSYNIYQRQRARNRDILGSQSGAVKIKYKTSRTVAISDLEETLNSRSTFETSMIQRLVEEPMRYT